MFAQKYLLSRVIQEKANWGTRDGMDDTGRDKTLTANDHQENQRSGTPR